MLRVLSSRARTSSTTASYTASRSPAVSPSTSNTTSFKVRTIGYQALSSDKLIAEE
jgi:hypothetical protein